MVLSCLSVVRSYSRTSTLMETPPLTARRRWVLSSTFPSRATLLPLGTYRFLILHCSLPDGKASHSPLAPPVTCLTLHAEIRYAYSQVSASHFGVAPAPVPSRAVPFLAETVFPTTTALASL